MPKTETRTFEFHEGTSQKFWTITLEGSAHTVQFGRIGTLGQEQKKEFDSPAEARKSFEKLIAEKVKKGYQEKTGLRAVPVAKTSHNAAAGDPRLREALEGLDQYLRKTDHEMYKALKPGASAAQLEELSKAVFKGGPVPPSLYEWFSWHNGQRDGEELFPDRTFILMSLKEAISTWKGMRGMRANPNIEPWQAARWDDDWLPIMTNGGGDYMSFDTGPEKHGSIDSYWHDDPEPGSDEHFGPDIGFESLHELVKSAIEMREEAARPIPQRKISVNFEKSVPLTDLTRPIVDAAPTGTIYYGRLNEKKHIASMKVSSNACVAAWEEGLDRTLETVLALAKANDPMQRRDIGAAVSFGRDSLEKYPAEARTVVAKILDS